MPEVTVDIAASAQLCYARLCAVDRIPEWLSGVADVVPLDTDDRDRATRVRFVSMPGRGSLAYELLYEYDDATRTIRWRSVEVALRDLRGHATFHDVGPGQCRLEYGMHNATSDALPGWARDVLGEETPEKVAYAFRRWIET